jgi:hypothetical protein
MTAIGYTGPIPPAACIQSRLAHDGETVGMLYKIRGGGAVFDPSNDGKHAPPYLIKSWRKSTVEQL